MKLTLTAYVTVAMFCATHAFAQQISKDSVQMLKNEKESIELSKEINEKKLKLAEKVNELQKKTSEMNETAAKAQGSADANTRAAADLTANPTNEKLGGKASSAAKDAQRDAKNARKAAGDVDDLKKDVAKLTDEINEMEQKLAGGTQLASPATTGTQVSQTEEGRITTPNQTSATTGQLSAAATPDPAGNQAVLQRNIIVDSLGSIDAASLAQRVLESTYKGYPQQQGQPAIIINNIIVPPDYNRQRPEAAPARRENLPIQDSQDYEDYQAWLRYKRGERAPYPSNSADAREPLTQEERITFRERFGEKPARHSGLWVIPMAGIHASNFNADFQDGKYEGRSGWNAGLDFRFRMRKFFIQPGAHYFSSSLDVSQEDSLSNAPLLTGPRIHSLKAPLMLGVYLTKAKGGFFRINVKGGIVGNYVLAVDKNDKDRFDKDNIEEFSYGLNAGIGLEFGFVTLDFSHEWGMSPLFKDTKGKNNILRATLGFKL